MIYKIDLPDLSGLTPDDELELQGQTHVPFDKGNQQGGCGDCSLYDHCPPAQSTYFCGSLPKTYIFKLK